MTKELQEEENQKIAKSLERLKERYEADGLSLSEHLKGLYHNTGVNYWDYISVDTLLSLQKPITGFHDETIFITYHQICELYFKLCIHELERLTKDQGPQAYGDDTYEKYIINPKNWETGLKRIKRYFLDLNRSMPTMKSGHLSKEEFIKFRLALIPASGFQTAQFRKMEIMMTSLENLTFNKEVVFGSIKDRYEKVYWKTGAVRMVKKESGFEIDKDHNGKPKKAKTLMDFEGKYDKEFLGFAKLYEKDNLYSKFQKLPSIASNQDVKDLLKEIDSLINLAWKKTHYKSIKDHLLNPDKKDEEQPLGTGGTNWKEYLPPENQNITYFPSIYSA